MTGLESVVGMPCRGFHRPRVHQPPRPEPRSSEPGRLRLRFARPRLRATEVLDIPPFSPTSIRERPGPLAAVEPGRARPVSRGGTWLGAPWCSSCPGRSSCWRSCGVGCWRRTSRYAPRDVHRDDRDRRGRHRDRRGGAICPGCRAPGYAQRLKFSLASGPSAATTVAEVSEEATTAVPATAPRPTAARAA